MSGPDAGARGPGGWLWPAGLGAAAFALRCLDAPAVFTPDGLRLTGPDAHYHLRRIAFTVENFPQVLGRDPYVNFPHGGEAIWSPSFDWLLALLALPWAGGGDADVLATGLVWVPPLLGALCVAGVVRIGARLGGTAVGALAGAILALLPPHVWYSQLGFVDHHAAIALVTTLLLAVATRLFERDEPPAGSLGLPLGAALGASFLIWPGCLLHVAIVQAALALAALTAPDVERARAWARVGAGAQTLALLLVAPLCLGRSWAVWGDVSPVVLSHFQPLWLGLGAASFGVAALAWRPGAALAATRTARAATLLAAAAAGAAALALAVPGLAPGLGDAARWLGRDESFQRVVAESLPLLRDGQGPTLRRALGSFSPAFLAWPLALGFLAARAWREGRPALLLLAGWATALTAATLAQYRFANSLSVAYALVWAWVAHALWSGAEARWPGRRGLHAVVALALAIGLVASIARPATRRLGTLGRELAGEAVLASVPIRRHQALVGMAAWLREHSPPTAGWLAPDARPEYGVLAPWGDGHVLRWVARRPVVQDNFGDDVGRQGFDAAERYYGARDEGHAAGLLDALPARYVVARAAGSGHAAAPYAPDSMASRLHRFRGAATALRDPAAPDGRRLVPALGQHRLLYESAPLPGEDAYRLYERVSGARLEGRAAPGAAVEARVELARSDGAAFTWSTATRADPSGRYRLTLPYPTEPFPGQFTATGPYWLRSGTGSARLAIGEERVRAGAPVAGPDLRPDG